MGERFVIPQGEEKITVELTLKEAMAIMGQQFPYGAEVRSSAKRKVLEAVERKYEICNK